MAQANNNDSVRENPGPALDPVAGIRLKLRRIAIDTYHENVAYLHRDCVAYRAEGFQALAKIRVSRGGERGVGRDYPAWPIRLLPDQRLGLVTLSDPALKS